VMDRGYIDFERLFVFTLCSAFFVVRTKENVLLQRRYSHPVDKSTGVRSDHTVILAAINSAKAYPDSLRRVSYLDIETKKRLKFLCWWPSLASVLGWRRVFTKFYRFSASPVLKKCPFYRCSKHSTPNRSYSITLTS
jgi:hypothetical protein